MNDSMINYDNDMSKARSSVDLSHLGSGKFRGGLSPRSGLSPGRPRIIKMIRMISK